MSSSGHTSPTDFTSLSISSAYAGTGQSPQVAGDAIAHYKKYQDVFHIDDVPEAERLAVAREVADWVLAELKKPKVSHAA